MRAAGVLGIPFSFYDAMDGLVAGLIGSVSSIIVWSLLCSVAVLFLYRLCSPQAKLRVFKQRMREIQSDLIKDPDDLALMLRLSGENIRIALTRFLYTFLPTCIAILPLLSLTSWLNAEYGYVSPESSAQIEATGMPGEVNVRVETVAEGLVIFDATGTRIGDVELPPQGQGLGRKVWWNMVLGNPMGYLSDDASINSVEFNFERREFISFGPGWLRGWEAIFLLGMTVFSSVLKIAFKVE